MSHLGYRLLTPPLTTRLTVHLFLRSGDPRVIPSPVNTVFVAPDPSKMARQSQRSNCCLRAFELSPWSRFGLLDYPSSHFAERAASLNGGAFASIFGDIRKISWIRYTVVSSTSWSCIGVCGLYVRAQPLYDPVSAGYGFGYRNLHR